MWTLLKRTTNRHKICLKILLISGSCWTHSFGEQTPCKAHCWGSSKGAGNSENHAPLIVNHRNKILSQGTVCNMTSPFLLSVPSVFNCFYPQLCISEIGSSVIICQVTQICKWLKWRKCHFSSQNMDLWLPNLGWYWTELFLQHCALQLLHSQLDTAWFRDQRIYLYCPPVS